MTTEERLETVETAIKLIVDYEGRVLGLVTELHQAILDTQQLVTEVRRDANHTQRLWVHLARKHGWLDDEDWGEATLP